MEKDDTQKPARQYIIKDQNISANFLFQSEQSNFIREMSNGDPDIQRPWEFYASAFSAQLNGNEDWSKLHLSVVPMYINWGNSDNGQAYFLSFADQVPSWQGRYIPDSRGFYEAYRLIVTSYAIEYSADPTLQAKAREKAYILEVALRDYDDGWINVGYRWRSFDSFQKSTFPPNRWKSFDEWYASNGSNSMTILRDRITLATAEYQSVMNNMGVSVALLAEAIKNVSNDAYFIRAKAEDGTVLPYPGYTTDFKFNDFVDTTLENLRKDPKYIAFHFNFNYQTGYRSESNTKWGASGNFSLGGGFAVNVGGNWEERRIDTSSKNFEVNVEFGGFREFVLKPGLWYSAAVLQTIKNGPWVNNSVVDRWLKQGREIWGKDGLLSLQGISALIAIQPRIRISLSSNDYHYYRKAYSAGAGVSFFGFRIGGGGGGNEHITITWDDRFSTFEIIDNSGLPMLIATRSEVMPR
ncbi:hypothetical protein J1F62_29520 (plasmid) [Klebsiella michiganensis]|uniref:hypothetical protein n=1 Tax=Klebsiella michiganensis TaxID=1134687 RepID=UPI001A92CEFD|nr:hypothetical protein [Klebsiella michiganensis]QSW17784.1 hypothetical protein J1F62_29520 [Klebsiella michiganensis]